MQKKRWILFLLFILCISFVFFVKLQYSIFAPMEDYEYKKNVIFMSKNLTYKLENLRPLVGPNELEKFI